MKNYLNTILFFLAAVVFSASPVFAGKLKLSLSELPEYKNNTNFRLYYTYFETEGKIATVNLFIQKDGKDWRQTSAKNKTAVSGYFQLEGLDIYDNAGKYNFYAEAKTADQTIKSVTVSTTLDDTAPNPPSEYGKERLNATTYKLSWKNPSDEDFAKVYIYRSKNTSFTADISTRISEAGGSKDEKMTFTDGSVEADVTYYYALRALDRAGNASGVVTDAPGTVTAGQVAGVSTVTGTTGTVGTVGSQAVEETVELLPETETPTPVETTEGQLGGGSSAEAEGEVQGTSTADRRPWFIVGGSLILGLVALFFFLKRRKAE